MTEISLREYTNRIRETLRAGKPAEAIEMCRHVLHHHPKYVGTYVLLGQALLDQNDYEQAGDILTLVLSADPENLVAYVGMSMAHENAHMLDEAIWDMERAFEINPNNVGIREELMRLRGQRDGIGRYRIKLTSGALGRLYAQGDLYTRAIQEFETVLRQEPARLDMQLAMAEVLWRQRRPGDAVDLCQQILARAPNCLKANLLLGKIWQEMGMADEGHRLLQLAQELDPDNEVALDMFEDQTPLPSRRVKLPLPIPAAPVAEEAAARPMVFEPMPEEMEAEFGEYVPALVPADVTVPEWMRADVLFAEELAEASSEEPEAAPPPPPDVEPEPPPPPRGAEPPERIEAVEPEPLMVDVPEWMRPAMAEAMLADRLRFHEEVSVEEPPPVPEPTPAEAPAPPIEEEAPPLPEWLAEEAPPVEEEPPPLPEWLAEEAPPVEEEPPPLPEWLAEEAPPLEEEPPPSPEPTPVAEREGVEVVSAFLRAEEFRDRLGAILSEAGLEEGELPAEDLYRPAGAGVIDEAPPPVMVEKPLGVDWAQQEAYDPGQLPSWLDESMSIQEAVGVLQGPEAEEPPPVEPRWMPPPWLTGEWKPPGEEPPPPEPPVPPVEEEAAWAPPSWLAEPVPPAPPAEEPAWAPPPWLAEEVAPAEEIAPPVEEEEAWAPPPWLAAEPAPVEELAPFEEGIPVEEAAPAEEPAPVEELVPVEEVTPAEEPAPVEEPTPVEERFAPLEPPAIPTRERLAPDVLQDYVEGLLVEPNDYYARLIVASAYQDAGKHDLALEHYETIIQSAPSLPEQVVANLEDIVRTVPNSEKAHQLLGDAYLKQGRHDDAIAQYNQALELQ